jgi:hypothetical protein
VSNSRPFSGGGQQQDDEVPTIFVGNLPQDTIQADMDDIFKGCRVREEEFLVGLIFLFLRCAMCV